MYDVLSYRRLFYEIIDFIETNVTHRFNDIAKLKILSLLHSRQSQDFKNKLLEDVLINLKENYGNFFDIPKLRSDLLLPFSDETLHKDSIINLHTHLIESDLVEVLPEVCRLAPVSYTHLDVYKRQPLDSARYFIVFSSSL